MNKIIIATVVALAVSACGGGGGADTSGELSTNPSPSPSPTPSPVPSPSPSPTPSPAASPTPTPSPAPSPTPAPVSANYGSIAVIGSPGANQFTPCVLSNIQDAIFVFSCNDSNSVSTLSLGFHTPNKGSISYQYVDRSNGRAFSYNNNYNTQYAALNKAARQITFSNTALDFGFSTGNYTSLPATINLNGSLSY